MGRNITGSRQPLFAPEGPITAASDHGDSNHDHEDRPEPQLGTQQADQLDGGAGPDHLVGRNGDDTINGLQGKDWLYGNNGRDLLNGGEGRDYLYGGNGSDLLQGSQGRDDLFGENGDDVLMGGAGPDLLTGGRGDDILYGGSGSDTYTGGHGRDIFVLGVSTDQHTAVAAAGLLLNAVDSGHEEDGDLITDFHQGVDRIGLIGGLQFDDLSFDGDAIYATSREHFSTASLSPWLSSTHGEEGMLLARLTGFNTNQLTADDFVIYSDAAFG